MDRDVYLDQAERAPGQVWPAHEGLVRVRLRLREGLAAAFDLDAIRVPYKTTPEEIERRKLDDNGRRNTEAGFGRDRTKTYAKGGADPGNVVSAPQSYNQHYGPAGEHTAVMPEGLAAFFIKACCPSGGVVMDPFAESAPPINRRQHRHPTAAAAGPAAHATDRGRGRPVHARSPTS